MCQALCVDIHICGKIRDSVDGLLWNRAGKDYVADARKAISFVKEEQNSKLNN